MIVETSRWKSCREYLEWSQSLEENCVELSTLIWVALFACAYRRISLKILTVDRCFLLGVTEVTKAKFVSVITGRCVLTGIVCWCETGTVRAWNVKKKKRPFCFFLRVAHVCFDFFWKGAWDIRAYIWLIVFILFFHVNRTNMWSEKVV